MARGRKGATVVLPEPVAASPVVVDSTAWILDSGFAEFVLMHTHEIKYMCMLGYTFLHGCKLLDKLPSDASLSFKFVSMILACTGGGILVPIFINSIPVPLSQDAYPVAIAISFLLHWQFPILREVVHRSRVLRGALVVLYETLRAYVVVKFTSAAAVAIAPSEFDIPIFGPIFCGTVAGCGGAFLPLSKGLDPIQWTGLAEPMITALVAATGFHLVVHTSLSQNVVQAAAKAHVAVALLFIVCGLYSTLWHAPPPPKAKGGGGGSKVLNKED